jgi:hypothetical protein
MWGLDLVGPLQRHPWATHICPISKIKSEQAVLFFTDIIHLFGVSNSIITDNGTQFTGKKFLEFCDHQSTTTYVWTSQQWPTQKQMAKWNMQMA